MTIIASGFGLTDSASLEITPAIPISFQVTPANNTVAVGLTQSFIATAQMSDGSTRNVTNEPSVSWISSNSAVATISSNQSFGNGIATGVSLGTVTITASGFGVTGSASLESTPAIPIGLQVTPASSAVAVGLTQNFIATLQMSDGSTRNVTNDPSVSWSSSDSTVATISSSQSSGNGVATGVSVDIVTITASGFGFTRLVSLNVTSAVPIGLQVTPTNSAIAVGLTQSFIATALMSDGSTRDVTNDPEVSWVSSNNAVVSITSNQSSGNGVARGDGVGSVGVTATGFGITTSTSLEITPAVPVGLQVTPVSSTIAVGLTQGFTATVQMSDSSTRDVTNESSISWSSSNGNIATISSSQSSGNGVATGVNVGTVTIIASGFGFTHSASLDITSAVLLGLQVTSINSTTAVGLTQSFTATAQMSDGSTYDVTDDPVLSWLSSNSNVATISSNQSADNGILTGVNIGTVSITATKNNITSNTVIIDICHDLASSCIDIFDDGSGKLFTNSPSVAYLDSIGGSATYSIFSENGDYGPTGGRFYTFGWDDANTLCATYNTQSIGGRTNWRLATLEELHLELYERFGDMYVKRGWPTNFYYWSSTSVGSLYYGVALREIIFEEHNRVGMHDPNLIKDYASCISNP
ncbi:Ig-like domain-containing protein [Vibrio cholerae]|nr:Ig-like domain-containing protein [Vibrio cholerae]